MTWTLISRDNDTGSWFLSDKESSIDKHTAIKTNELLRMLLECDTGRTEGTAPAWRKESPRASHTRPFRRKNSKLAKKKFEWQFTSWLPVALIFLAILASPTQQHREHASFDSSTEKLSHGLSTDFNTYVIELNTSIPLNSRLGSQDGFNEMSASSYQDDDGDKMSSEVRIKMIVLKNSLMFIV